MATTIFLNGQASPLPSPGQGTPGTTGTPTQPTDNSGTYSEPAAFYGNPNSASGRIQNVSRYLYSDFQQMFGRAPTNAEFNQLLPSYLNSDNSLNQAGGKSQLSAFYTQSQNTPQNLYQQQQKQLQTQYTTDQPKIDPQVAQIFQSNLGRAPTPEETQHFGMLIASGQDPYQIQQALQQTTEYQNRQTQDFTKQLSGQLQSTNADYFSKYILPSIQASNAQAGRSQDSSGYQAQIANAGQQQNYDLQNYLAQVAAQGYQGSVANNAQNYQALLGQQYGIQNANISNSLQNQAYNQQYNQNLNMYNLQQQAYQNYLKNYGKTNGWSSVLTGALGGAATGGKVGGPWGALAGGLAGGGLGYASANGSGNALF